MSMIIDGTNGCTFPDTTVQTTTGKTGFVNRIINGAMVIDQRNAGASVTPTNLQYTVDRWNTLLTQSGKFSVQQNSGSVTPPQGFSNYLGAVSLSAYSVTAGDRFVIQQSIEGYNISDLGWGTAGAKTITVSFWVRSSLTGTFGGAMIGGAGPASYPFSYTINSANTWEQKTIVVPGATSDTWGSTNTNGISIRFSLGAASNQSGTANAWAYSSNLSSATGAVSVVGTSGATFYITGVQLEKGSTATSFDYRPYGTELALCQRYYYLGQSNSGYTIALGGMYSGSEMNAVLQHPVTMRTAPSFVATSGTNYYSFWANNTQNSFNTLNMIDATASNARLYGTVTVTIGYSGFLKTNNASSSIAFNAEL